MTTQFTRTVTGLPPPDFHVLLNHDTHVGWTEGDRIGFTGFADPHEAVWAAAVAQLAIARRRDRGGDSGTLDDLKRLTLTREAGTTWIESSGRRIARLVAPGEWPHFPGAGEPDSFGFEIVVAPPATELAVMSTSHIAYRGLRRSGLPWALFARDVPAPLPRATSTAPVYGPVAQLIPQEA